MDEHLILLNKDTGAASPGHVSSEKTFSLNCSDKAPQKEKHLRWIGFFIFLKTSLSFSHIAEENVFLAEGYDKVLPRMKISFPF